MSDKNKVMAADFDMDDLEDLPSFKAPPTGSYIVTLVNGLERKKVGEHDAVEAMMEIVMVDEVTETLEPDEAPPKEGDKFSTLFMLDNELGQGKLKDFMKPLKEACGSGKFSDIQKFSKGIKLAVIGKRAGKKDDPEKKFFNIVKVATV